MNVYYNDEYCLFMAQPWHAIYNPVAFPPNSIPLIPKRHLKSQKSPTPPAKSKISSDTALLDLQAINHLTLPDPDVVLSTLSLLCLCSSLLIPSLFTFSTHCSVGPPFCIAPLLPLPSWVDFPQNPVSTSLPTN